MSSVYTYNAIFIVHVIHTLWNKNGKQKKQNKNSTVFNLWFELSLNTKGTSSNQFATLNYIVDI